MDKEEALIKKRAVTYGTSREEAPTNNILSIWQMSIFLTGVVVGGNVLYRKDDTDLHKISRRIFIDGMADHG